jgi:quinolinate synthase
LSAVYEYYEEETQKNPDKKVFIPDMEAGCSLAEGCPPFAFRQFREDHPNHVAITYINCSAEVKALSDIICTSSNAEKNYKAGSGINANFICA